LLALLWGVWLLVPPVLVFDGAITAAPFFGEQPTDDERSEAAALFLVAGLLAVGVPLVGLVLTVRARARVATGAFVVALVVGAVVLAMSIPEGWWRDRNAPPAQTTDPPVVCQEHSGGDNDCPGG
jgi:hypothetical protein